MPLRLYLVRHGETAWSLSGRHTGRTDIALTAHGDHQARELAQRLRDIQFAHVLTSPRLRARRTCELAGLAAAAADAGADDAATMGTLPHGTGRPFGV